MCNDGLNELADISLGDAWLRELVGRLGNSMIIARTEVGEAILQKAILKERVRVTRITENKVVRAQKSKLFFKKKNLKARMSLLKRFIKIQPENDLSGNQQNTLKAYLGAILTYLNVYLSSREEFFFLLKPIPLTILRKYARLMTKLTLRE